jgi:Raf kinase inhibitor-like YbhB/YbcL family protein
MRNTFQSGLALVVVVATSALFSGGCSAESKLASRSAMSGGLWTVKVTSPAFNNAEAIPEKYTQEGLNISPPLKWTAGPSGVREWAVVIEDADATYKDGPNKGLPLVHWAVYKIPGNVTELAEGAASSIQYPQGKNYLGENNYAGPKPPPGKKHRYFIQVFALDSEQEFSAGMDRHEIKKKFKGFVLSKGQLVGTYTSPKE